MHTMLRSARAGRVVGWVLCFALLSGCGGGGPEGNEYVEYDGTTLIVEGTAFEREATMDPPGTYLAGRIVVQPADKKKADEAAALVKRYGLTLEGHSSEGWLLVKGPAGFEMQWASAIQGKLGGTNYATNDSAQSPTPIAVAAETENADAGEPVPDHEPTAEDVRRIVFDRYERLEDAGGLPATMTATGQSMVIHAKVFEVTKTSCRQVPPAEPGEWECEADTMMGACTGDCDPSDEEPLPHGDRVPIRWDPAEGRYTLDD